MANWKINQKLLLRRLIQRENIGKAEIGGMMWTVECNTRGLSLWGRENRPAAITGFVWEVFRTQVLKGSCPSRFKKPMNPNQEKQKQTLTWHIAVKLQNTKMKRPSHGKREMTIRPTADFSTATISPRRHWTHIFKRWEKITVNLKSYLQQNNISRRKMKWRHLQEQNKTKLRVPHQQDSTKDSAQGYTSGRWKMNPQGRS